MTAPTSAFARRTASAQPTRPTLTVVVDTEEEFDWHAPFSRDATSVTAMRHLHRAQSLCEAAGVVPTYVIDYPVAAQPEGVEQLAAWARAGQCEIGAHLHPWVNPPHEEPVTRSHSYTCNLSPDLQRAKLKVLCEAVEAHTGFAPRVFKAGRYGVGPHLIEAFPACGLTVDASVNPCMDFRGDDGPDYSAFDARPFWIDRTLHLFEVPCTHGFIGWARRYGRSWRRTAERFERFRVPGILARSGTLDRVMLSPEGNTLAQMKALTLSLVEDGHTVFSLTFHSPSVEPGHTPYVRSTSDLTAFLSTIQQYFEFFFGEIGGVSSTPTRLREAALAATQPTFA